MAPRMDHLDRADARFDGIGLAYDCALYSRPAAELSVSSDAATSL